MNAFEFVFEQYGFRWGPLMVQRTCSDPKGGIVITVLAACGAVEIRVSPKGRKMDAEPLRPLYDHEREMLQGDA